MSKINYMEL